MIVTCEKCDTRYRLDDARVSQRGARVRCSRCRHAFYVPPSAATAEDLAHRVAEQAAESAVDGPADVTQDLFGFTVAGGSKPAHELEEAAVLDERGPRAASGAPEDGEESDWQFSEDPPEPDPSAPADRLQAARSAIDELLQRGGSEDDEQTPELGSPDRWDFLGADHGAAEDEPAPGEDLRLDDGAGERDGSRSAAESVEQVHGDAPAAQRWAFGEVAARASSVGAWGLTLLLVGYVAWGSLTGPNAASRARTSVDVAGLRAEDLRGRFIENAYGPSLFVVSGRLVNRGAQRRTPDGGVRARLLDRRGAPLVPSSAAWAVPSLDERTLREAAPETFGASSARRAARLAGTALAPGEGVAFDAVFVELPPAAARFDLESTPVPSRPQPPASAGEISEGGRESKDAAPSGARPASDTGRTPQRDVADVPGEVDGGAGKRAAGGAGGSATASASRP